MTEENVDQGEDRDNDAEHDVTPRRPDEDQRRGTGLTEHCSLPCNNIQSFYCDTRSKLQQKLGNRNTFIYWNVIRWTTGLLFAFIPSPIKNFIIFEEMVPLHSAVRAYRAGETNKYSAYNSQFLFISSPLIIRKAVLILHKVLFLFCFYCFETGIII